MAYLMLGRLNKLIFSFLREVFIMASQSAKKHDNTALLLGAGLAVTSMIILPAFAMRLGLGASLTGALRIALMKASNKAAQAQFIQEKANC